MKTFTRRAKTSVLALLPLFCLIIAAQPLMVGSGLVAPEPMGAYLNGVFPEDVPTGSTGGEVNYTIENAFPNLTFIDPVDMVEIPDRNEFIVIGLQGHVWKIPNSPDATDKQLLLDLSPNTVVFTDGGMLGVMLHPEFGQPGSPNAEYLYLFYRYTPVVVDDSQVGSEVNGYMRLSRFSYVAGANSIDPNSEYVLIQVFDRNDWHNGGDMFFGNDGFLYLVVGDEGGANDSYNVTQQIDKWLFSGVLRIDVDMQGGNISHPIRRQPQNAGTPPAGWPDSFTQGYYIPNDNPWLDENGGVLEEFFAIGTRSPHRMSYDPQTGEIWIGDVGQAQIEEVSIVRKGDNLQWPYMEGTRVTGKAKPSPLIGTDAPPVYDYNHSVGTAVIGGFVYRGNRYPEIKDKYFFGDHGAQNVWTLQREPSQEPNPNSSIIINACEDISGWVSHNPLSVSADAREGNGSIQAVGSGTDDFRLNFTPVNGTNALNLEFWYYVSDVSLLTSNNQVELGSAGRPDISEYNWNIPTSSLVNGWNYISLPLNGATSTGGDPDLSALNWFRLYRFKNGSVTSKIDDVHLSAYDPTPTTVELLLNVNREGEGGKQGISSFFIDSRENIYILDLFGTNRDGGKIHRVVRNSVGVADPPQSLSEVGAFTDLSTLTTAPGIIPYDVNAPLWSDRAEKKRWIALPNDGSHNSPTEQITFDAEGNWQFPPGTVFIKHFELPTDERDPTQSVRLETRFLVFTALGDAYGVTYRWNEAGTDAFLVGITAEESRNVVITALDGTTWTQTWDFPSRQQCMQCHNPAADFSLGVRTRQINKDFHYTATDITANQLETWNALGMFDRDIGAPDELPASAHILDDSYSEEFRIRSYIDANCSFCHRPGGTGGTFDARAAVALHDQNMINTPATSNASPIGKMVIDPGLPAESVLWLRDQSEGPDRMPPVGRRLQDPDYISALTNWISNLSTNGPAAITEGWYHLQVKHTAKLATVENASLEEQASVVQADEVTQPEQQWFLEDLGNQKFRMTVGHSDMVMALRTPQPGQGVEVVQESWTGEQHQMWYFQETTDGYFRIINAYSSKALEVPSAGATEGLPLAVAQPGAGDHQHWLPIPVTPVGPNEVPVAVAAATPTSGVAPLTVTLYGRGSTDTDGNIVTYSWRQDTEVLGTGDVLIKDFNEGIHEVILEVTDDRGAMEDDTVTINVAPAPVCNDVPAPWQVTYIGDNDLGGEVCYDNGTFTIQSAGVDIWNASDHFRFVHQPLTCDGEIVARVESLENTNAWAKAGIMIRESLASDSRHAMMIASYSSGLSFQYRTVTGASSGAMNQAGSWPKWVSVLREGDVFTGSYSDDGVNWTVAGQVTIEGMADEVLVGMAVTSHNANAMTTGVIQNVGVSKLGCINELPIAQIDAQPVNGTVPLTVNFDGSGSSDSDGNIIDFTWDFGDGNTGSGQTASHTYTITGTYNATLTVTDDGGAQHTEQTTITVDDAGPNLTSGVVSGVGSTWQTVIMPESYTSAVIIATPSYAASDLPAVTRIRNTAGNSFELKVENPSGTSLSGYTVFWVAVEEGVYTVADAGVNMEVVKYTSTITDRNGAWNGEARSYFNSYTNPVVLGQVQTDNDIWSSFWCRGGSATSPPDASTLFTGKMVAEDNITSRANETIGYIVVEQGSYTLSGQNVVTALGADIVQGTTNAPPYSYSISGLTQATSAVASLAAMDGNNGGWAYFYGADPVTATGIDLAIDEDMIRDTERGHITEQVGYMVVEGTIGNQSPIANAGTYTPKIDVDNSGAETITLDGSSSTDPDGYFTLYEWDVDNDGTFDLTGPVNDASFSVAGSPHTVVLRVTDNEGATHQDVVTITVEAGSTANDIYWLEAECGVVGSNWDILYDNAASNGSYVVYPSGNMGNLDLTKANNPDNQITSDVNLEAGVYHLFFRVIAASGNDDSFWVQVDDGSWIKFWRGMRASGFEWKKVTHDGNDVSFNLSAGVHTIKVVYREDGTILDKLVIKQGTGLPAGLGDAASNCGGSNLRITTEVSINEESESLWEDQITALVYPNPVAKGSQLLTVDIKNPEKGEVLIQLFDLFGRIVINKQIEMTAIQRFEQFDLSAEANGAHYLRVKRGDWENVTKVIIQ